MDDTHDPNWRPEGNASPIGDLDPTPHPRLRPPTQPDVPDDDLVFTGVNHTPVFHRFQPHVERENLHSSIVSIRRDLGISERHSEEWRHRVLEGLGGQKHVVDVSNRNRSSKIKMKNFDSNLEANYVTPVCLPCGQSYMGFSSTWISTMNTSSDVRTDSNHGSKRTVLQDQVPVQWYWLMFRELRELQGNSLSSKNLTFT